jgi:protein Mpv17
MMLVNLRFWIASVFVLSTLAISASAFAISAPAASQAWDWYKSMLVARPLLTKSLISSGIMTVSDAICQKLTLGAGQADDKKKQDLDFTRIVQVAITGLSYSGPITHVWYGTLEKIVKIQDPLIGLIARIILDAIIFSPVTVSGYFTVRSILEGSGFQGAREKLEARFVSTVLGAWKFWPLANIINFGLIPLEFRVLYVNVLSLFWTGYLSYVNAQKTATNTEKKKK